MRDPINTPITCESDPRFKLACQGILEAAANRPQGGYSVVYMDYGISDGMRHGIEAAEQSGLDVVYRKILEPGV